MGWFDQVPASAPIEIFELARRFREDSDPNKVDLGIGAYRTEEARPWVLPVVRDAEIAIANDTERNHEYLGQLGLESFNQAAVRLLLGDDSPALKQNRVIAVQSLSGTGALRLVADFLRDHLKPAAVYISAPSWPNHHLIFKHSGYQQVRTYRYWQAEQRVCDFAGMIEDLSAAPERSLVVLHACAHNPTGVDLSHEQWEALAKLVQEKKLFPLFDSAYQGFASGDPDRDAWAIRFFEQKGIEFATAQSFAKNFGLYDERAGLLSFVLQPNAPFDNIRASLALFVRGNYSTPPAHGARVVSRVLNDPVLKARWLDHVKEMAGRILKYRAVLRQELEALGTPGTWEHITNQIGMFSYTGLNEKQCDHLVKNYHLYLPKSGRISIAGINGNNVKYIATAINETLKTVQ